MESEEIKVQFLAPIGAQGMLISVCPFVWHKVSKSTQSSYSGSDLQLIIKGSPSDIQAVLKWSSRGLQ